MASASDVIAMLDKFEVQLVEKEWSDDIWSSDFTSCPDDLPEEFADKFSPLSYSDIVQVIEGSDKIINLWLEKPVDTSTISDVNSSNSFVTTTGPSWTLLKDVNYKQILALIYYYTCKGQINNQDINLVNTCIKATKLYFTLLIIPGSDIYKIFHINLFEKCLETFSMHKFLEIATGRKVPRVAKRNGDISSDDEFLEMDETLKPSQQQAVVKELNLMMLSFQAFVKKFSFNKYPEALSMSLAVLAELTRVERNCSPSDFSTNNNITSFAPLSRNAYLTLKDLCSSFHGRVSEIIRLVLFYLMPNLTSVGGLANPEINKFSPKELTNIRSIAVCFIIENIIPLGENAHSGLRILIQQLCFNMIDRADYRSKATDMVLAILCKLPTDLYFSIIKWILRMSMIEGAHHRVISLEILSKLIFMKPGSNETSKLTDSQYQHLDSVLQNSENTNITESKSEIHQKTDNTSSLSQERVISFSQPVNYVPLEYRRIMLAIIIDRIRDEAAIVRTRALSILSDIISNRTSQALQLILRDLFIRPYSEIAEIKLNNNNKENEFLKWKSFVHLLNQVQDAKVSKDMFPGARVIVRKVFEKCLDERVNVRKAALQVISSLFKFSAKWMTSETLALFGKHCRDPAMSIRKDMINSVTDLLILFSDKEALMELWVEEVVPLIMDREIKVQEQALQIFTNTILSKMKTFNEVRNDLDKLPWKLIDKISKQNKRSFFMAACALWSESGNFNQSLIRIVESHIRTINDAPAWVFFSCVSEYFDIEKPEFVMEYYQDVISKQDSGDEKKSYFALLTLSNSWQNLPKDRKEILQSLMFSKLKSFSVNPTFVTLTAEIVAGITVDIAEDELSGKKEVAKFGIELIQECEEHLENCFKISGEKNRQCANCINVLALLGALVGICPNKIKNSTFSMLFDFLMESSNGGSTFDRKMCAITVITTSKIALQNDLFARSFVAGLAQLLSHSSDPIVLNNVVVAISDIGESYASLIEPVIPFLSICLKSKHQSLKEITMTLLIELLQEDYLKARGVLVFQLLTMINESNPWLVNVVKYYFTNSFLLRNPYKMYQLLLPGLFHFNKYTSHPDYPCLDMNDAEWRAFDLSGPENHFQRMSIYKFMLSNIPNMVKMKCLHFICTVVLNGVADGIINIKKKNGEQLLFDAFCVLTTQEIKIEYNDLVKNKNEDGEEEEDQKQLPICKLVKRVFTAVQKKEIIETIIPICCKLKKKLLTESKKLIPYLRKFVRELVKDYKSEINELFKEDKQFGVEILHELDQMTSCEAGEDEAEELDQIMNLEGNANPTESNENVGTKETEKATKHFGNLSPTPEVNKENESEGERLVEESSQEKVAGNGDNIPENSEEMIVSQDHVASEEQSSKNKWPEIQEEKQLPFSNGRMDSVDGLECGKSAEQENSKGNSERKKEKYNATRSSRVSSSRHNSKLTSEKNEATIAPCDNLQVIIERLSFDHVKGPSKRQKEENAMKKAVNNIIIPGPAKGSGKGKKYSIASSKSCISIQSPTTPNMNEKKELLTSTPLVTIDNPNFDMDISSVIDENN